MCGIAIKVSIVGDKEILAVLHVAMPSHVDEKRIVGRSTVEDRLQVVKYRLSCRLFVGQDYDAALPKNAVVAAQKSRHRRNVGGYPGSFVMGEGYLLIPTTRARWFCGFR